MEAGRLEQMQITLENQCVANSWKTDFHMTGAHSVPQTSRSLARLALAASAGSELSCDPSRYTAHPSEVAGASVCASAVAWSASSWAASWGRSAAVVSGPGAKIIKKPFKSPMNLPFGRSSHIVPRLLERV